MKKLFLLTILLNLTFIVKAQTILSLDSCRALALANNKDLSSVQIVWACLHTIAAENWYRK